MSENKTSNPVGHIGLIPDGGRRWAKTKGLDLYSAYQRTMQKLAEYVEVFFDYGVSAISIYFLSKQNFLRTNVELDALFSAETEFISLLADGMSDKLDCSVICAGDISRLPHKMRLKLETLSNRKRRPRTVFLCLAYDPMDELVRARLSGCSFESADEILSMLDVDQRIDLVIRSGGAVTLSNFLPIQAAYARLIFLEELFNDTSVRQYLDIIRNHEDRSLLFGN